MNRQLAIPCIVPVLLVSLAILAAVPQPVCAQTGKGIELYKSWEFPQAEKVLREALKTNPQDIQASYYLGLAVLMQDKHNEALEIFEKVKEAQDKTGAKGRASVPDDFQIQIALARARLELKQNQEAWKNLETATKEHPDSSEVYVYRGLYYLNTGDPQKAGKELEKVLSLNAKDAYAHYYAGHAYLRMGNPAEAVEMFKTFLQLAPYAPEAGKAKALIDALC